MKYERYSLNNFKDVEKQLNMLHFTIFGEKDVLLSHLKDKKHVSVFCAFDKKLIVGYKIGYEKSSKLYCSWIGGVHPLYRGKGIAQCLMTLQHEWVSKNYREIETESLNAYKPMMILNLKNGFNIYDTYLNKQQKIKVVFRKQL